MNKAYEFVSLVVSGGAADLVQLANVSDKARDIAKRFYGRLLIGREAKDVSPEERQAFVKACIAQVQPNIAGQDFKKRLFRSGILSKVAAEMGFPLSDNKGGKKGKGKASVPVIKSVSVLKKVVSAMVKSGLSADEIVAAVQAAVK